MDFKILGTSSSVYARSNFSWQRVKILDGVIFTVAPKQSGRMEVTLVNTTLRRYSYEDLVQISNEKGHKFSKENLSVEYDVKNILKTVSCDKNILLFHSDFYFSDVIESVDEIVDIVLKYQNDCLCSLFEYREKTVPGRDTFLACIIEQYMCIGKIIDGHINAFERIPLDRSKSFLEIAEYVAPEYKRHFLG